MPKKWTKKRIIGWSIGLAVPVLVINSCLPWHQINPYCVPISKELGMRSEFLYSPSSLIQSFVPDGLPYDNSGGNFLYEIPNFYIKSFQPKVLTLIKDSPHNKNLFGLITLSNGETLSARWAKTSLYYQYMQPKTIRTFDKLDNKNYWSPTNALSMSTDLIFKQKPQKNSTYPSWDNFLGTCSNRPNGTWHIKYSKPPNRCDFEFIWQGLIVQYNIDNTQTHEYEVMEDFLIKNLLCKVE